MKVDEKTKEDLNILIVQLSEIFQTANYAVFQKKMIYTEWKMFVMNRSFILNVLCTLLNYIRLSVTFQKANTFLLPS